MIRRNTLFGIAVSLLFLAGCGREVPAPAQAAEQTQAVEQAPKSAIAAVEEAPKTVVAEAAPASTGPTIDTARGIVVRRAESLQNSTTYIHLMVQVNGPNDEKVYFSFNATSAFAHLPLARVGDRVELTYLNKGFIEVQTFGITEPAMPPAGGK